MSTIYLSQNGLYVNKNGGQIIIKTAKEVLKMLPAIFVENIIVLADVQISYAVIMEILSKNGNIIYLGKNGDVKGILNGGISKGKMLVAQAAAYLNEDKRMEIARYFLNNKFLAQKNFLAYYNKYLSDFKIKQKIVEISVFTKLLEKKKDINALLGIEGIVAKIYYDSFSVLLKKSDFQWNGRNRRPPKDPVNAMLSFAYYLLEKEVKISLADENLAVSIGYLHSLDNYRDSLVYDLMEPLRTLVAERFVFSNIRLKIVKPQDFNIDEGGCFFTDTSRKNFVYMFEEYIGQEKFNGKSLRGLVKEYVEQLKAFL